MKNSFFLNSIYIRLGIAGLISFVAIWFIPHLDNDLFPSHTAPGGLTMIGVSLVVTLLTAFALHTGINTKESVPQKFVAFALLYNVLFVVARLSLEPLALYQSNVTHLFDFPVNDPSFLIMFAGLSFVIYLIIFGILYHFFSRYAHRKIDSSKQLLSYKKMLYIGLACVAGLIILASTTTIFVMPFLYSLLASEFVYFMCTTVYGILGALAIIASLFFLGAAMKSVADQAIAVRDMAILSSFFWIAATFLLMYHALWVVYLITITTIWPLRVVIPK